MDASDLEEDDLDLDLLHLHDHANDKGDIHDHADAGIEPRMLGISRDRHGGDWRACAPGAVRTGHGRVCACVDSAAWASGAQAGRVDCVHARRARKPWSTGVASVRVGCVESAAWRTSARAYKSPPVYCTKRIEFVLEEKNRKTVGSARCLSVTKFFMSILPPCLVVSGDRRCAMSPF